MTDSEDSPAPPGGPLRQDAAGSGLDHQDTGVDREARASNEDKHGSTIPVDEEQSHPEPSPEEDDRQQENAETSLDQPSEG